MHQIYVNGLLDLLSPLEFMNPFLNHKSKTKLGSMYMVPNGKSIRSYIGEVLKKHLDNELHRRPDIAKAIQEKILFNEKQRKDINNIKKYPVKY